jgi:FkbM family methyltransferase
MRILDLYYRYWANNNLAHVTKKYRIEIDFIVEAGCHDGSDTIRLLEEFPNATILAYEPDNQARVRAQTLFSEIASERIQLFDNAISNVNEVRTLRYLDGIPGTGSSEISDGGDVSVNLRRLDDCIPAINGESGLLWLDVEGHAIQALQGMSMTLKKVKMAKIEIQMQKMSESRLKDYNEVIDLLRVEKLYPLFAPLHPGYFGDIVFVKREYLSALKIIKSKFLIFQLKILHDFVYPALRKHPAA